jgi:hypothetical protein
MIFASEACGKDDPAKQAGAEFIVVGEPQETKRVSSRLIARVPRREPIAAPVGRRMSVKVETTVRGMTKKPL